MDNNRLERLGFGKTYYRFDTKPVPWWYNARYVNRNKRVTKNALTSIQAIKKARQQRLEYLAQKNLYANEVIETIWPFFFKIYIPSGGSYDTRYYASRILTEWDLQTRSHQQTSVDSTVGQMILLLMVEHTFRQNFYANSKPIKFILKSSLTMSFWKEMAIRIQNYIFFYVPKDYNSFNWIDMNEHRLFAAGEREAIWSAPHHYLACRICIDLYRQQIITRFGDMWVNQVYEQILCLEQKKMYTLRMEEKLERCALLKRIVFFFSLFKQLKPFRFLSRPLLYDLCWTTFRFTY